MKIRRSEWVEAVVTRIEETGHSSCGLDEPNGINVTISVRLSNV